MTQIIVPATYLFCDFSHPDAEDLGTYLVWEIETRLKDQGIDIPVVNDGRNSYSPYVTGQRTIALERNIQIIITDAEAEIRRLVEEGEL